MGDFNKIMWSVEKKGGKIKEWHQMRRFREVLEICGLLDLGYMGSPFTWSNGRRGEDNIREKLDRALSNAAWKTIYQKIHIKHLARYKSDHSPLIVYCEHKAQQQEGQRRQCMFRFEHTWMHHNEFQEILKTSWNSTHMAEGLEEKITNYGASLTRWTSKEFGSIRKQKKELTEELKELQLNENRDGQQDYIRNIEQKLDQILTREETMWFQRSRALWLKDGDKNTFFFHQKASNRKRRNTIKQIQDENGK